MNNEDKKIIDGFLNGTIKGLSASEVGRKPKVIQTQFSRIFLFPKTVYKLYRKDSDYFKQIGLGDIVNNFLKRKNFYEQDFFVCHYFNKNVYQKLIGIKINGNPQLVPKNKKSIYDFVIKMKRIDTNQNLTQQLLSRSLTKKDFQIIGYKITKMIAEFPQKPQTNKTLYDIFKISIIDLKNLSYAASPFILKNTTNYIINLITKYFEKYRNHFLKLTSKDLIIGIDNQSDNVYYKNKKVSCLDSYLAKENWRIVEPQNSIQKLVTDVEVLNGKESANEMFLSYKKFYGGKFFKDELKIFYEIYFGLMRAALLYLIYKDTKKRKREADLYWKFTKTKLSEITKIIANQK